jgi:hypothetical protein
VLGYLSIAWDIREQIETNGDEAMRIKEWSRLTVLLAVMSLLLPSVLWAQNIVTGGISGTVTDPSGAVVPNATLTLKSNSTGETQVTTTGSTGL